MKHFNTNAVPKLLFSFMLAFCVQCAQKPVETEPPPPVPRVETRQAPSPRARTQFHSAEKVERNFSDLFALAGLDSVRASVNDNTGTVHLFGTVPDEATRDRLLAVAGSIQGVRNVSSELSVPSPVPPTTQNSETGLLTTLANIWPYALAFMMIVALTVIGVTRGSHPRRAPVARPL